MHIFNMLITSVQSFKLIAWKLWEELIIQTGYPILKSNLKIQNVQNVVILSKIIFLPAKNDMHIFNMLTTSVQKFIDYLKTLGGVDYTNWLPNIKA